MDPNHGTEGGLVVCKQTGNDQKVENISIPVNDNIHNFCVLESHTLWVRKMGSKFCFLRGQDVSRKIENWLNWGGVNITNRGGCNDKK